MRSKLITLSALNLAFIFISFSCSVDAVFDLSPPDIPIEQLLSSPDTILVDGRQLWLETFMWRDFMPGNPPDGSPLGAIIIITAVDSAPLPPSITSDAVWIVYNNQVWKSWLSDNNSPPYSPHTLVKTARDSPKWGPCMNCASVVVRVLDSNKKEYLLLAPNKTIGSTH